MSIYIAHRRRKTSNALSPFDMSTNLVRIGCALPDLFRKDWFFGPNSNYSYEQLVST